MKLIIFSDLHYGPEELGCNKFGVKRKLTQFAEPVIKKLIAEINKIKPDAVINLGDTIEDTKNPSLDLENFKYAYKLFSNIKVPFFSVTGNHDLRILRKEQVAEIMGCKDTTFSKDINGYHCVFLGLDTVTKKKEVDGIDLKVRQISPDDLMWLKDDIAKNKLPSLVFLHYGLADDDMKGNWWFENHPEDAVIQNNNAVKSILKTDKNLIGVFGGHQHWTKTTIEDGIPYHIIGSLTEDVNFNGIPEGIWVEVDIDGKNMKIIKHNIKLN